MKNYIYQNTLIGKKQLRQLLAWSFTNYNSIQACALADELKYLGFKYATQAGISISIEDLKIPFVKNLMLEKATQEIFNSEKIYLKGKITDVERFQKIIDTWSLTSESLKDQVVSYFKNYDPLNSVYIMAFSGARGNLSQVRQLVGMRGLMSDPSGQIMNLTIKKNFREGLTITDYLMSGYGARKGIVDTALKTANSGYLTRRLIDVGQDILIREKDCLTEHSFLLTAPANDPKALTLIYEKIIGRTLSNSILDPQTKDILVSANTQITPRLLNTLREKNIRKFYVRSPLTCVLYRAICQKCYGWDLANENLVDIGEAVGILAGQSIGEPGTQLTMRTFHTGGIFTSEARQQIISPLDGIIKFSKLLKTVILRTNRGEDVLITKNSGLLILVPDNKNQNNIFIDVLRNTILFPKNNQYILKDTVIGELINLNKQIKTEIKPILNENCGEIFIPKLKNKNNLINNNKLIWILFGQLYSSPKNSFLNFYPDYKLSNYTSIFRTKLINHYQGKIESFNSILNLYQRVIRVTNTKYSLTNSTLQKLSYFIQQNNYLLSFENSKYLVNLRKNNSSFYLQLSRTQQIGILVTKTFRTLTGGILFYDLSTCFKSNHLNSQISYLSRVNHIGKYKSLVSYRTLSWLGEEVHKVNCEITMLLVEHGDFISEGFELVPNTFSKTSGIVIIRQKANLVQTITIKCGVVYEGKKIKERSKKLYYPGELLLSTIAVKNLSFCEHISGKKIDQLLVRPVEIYEFPQSIRNHDQFSNSFQRTSNVILRSQSKYTYKPNQIIKGSKNLNLVSSVLNFNLNEFLKRNTKIEIFLNNKKASISFRINEKLILNNYVVPKLRYKNLVSSFLLQPNQFVDKYTVLGYIESISSNSLEIVKLKVKDTDTRQILVISNNDCFTIDRNNFPKKKVNQFITNSSNINEIGKIIIANEKFLTLQKGRPYFFPNCKNEKILSKTTLQYKISKPSRIQSKLKINKLISLNYYDLTRLSITRMKLIKGFKTLLEPKITIKTNFSKLFIKKNGKLYSLLTPKIFKKFSVSQKSKSLKCDKILRPKQNSQSILQRIDRTLLFQSSELVHNQFKSANSLAHQLVLVKFLETPLTKITKSVGLYSITEDYFEQDANSVFCKNSKFIEEGETIGLLNLEKEITGDIVQGLPRIEEILEARKKNLTIKRIPSCQKKGLLIQKTSLDPNFEFKSLGNSVQENEKINPHKLLKVYFNYYGLIKFFTCDQKTQMKYSRLIQNYEGSYKSFKKVQSFILNSVQSVYKSQGVSINDKHLEVIIRQMTTKVLITYEGNTPLLRREVIDLYHIQYINDVVYDKQKSPASYVPLLLGITKAALNNPSFISAASFQETTRVLTRAAIEGRIDWLRGLKENIIIGHLIPSGTGSQIYRNCFHNQSQSV